MKELLRNRGLVKRGGEGFSSKRGVSNCFVNFTLEKHIFITIGIIFLFVCLVNIHAWCNDLEIICTKRRNKLLVNIIKNEFFLNVLSFAQSSTIEHTEEIWEGSSLLVINNIWMYFSFTRTSDLIIYLLEMFHVHSSCTSNLKIIKDNN